jgi:hypothetical protein
MIEIVPDAPVGVWEYSSLKRLIANLFETPVDVVSSEALKPFVHLAATADAVYAF